MWAKGRRWVQVASPDAMGRMVSLRTARGEECEERLCDLCVRVGGVQVAGRRTRDPS